MSELLERERELAELAALAAEACAGTGRLAVIEAPAGLGKTRLLQAARESGRRAGMQVLTARATELERDFPFALARQLFAPALAALDDPAREALLGGAVGPARGALGIAQSEPTADTFAVLHGLYWLTAAFAEQQPLLLAVDDAHWSDAASLDFLRFLVPRLEELPVLLALTCRPDEAGAERGLARIATDSLARRLTPRALSPHGTAALLTGELGRTPDEAFTATCHEVSGGNPFLLRELARTLAAEAIDPAAGEASRVRELAPERVTRTVQLRLAQLSPEARAVARAVVILGDDVDGRLVAELVGLVEPDVARGADELRAAAILDQDVALRFIHPLVRTALDAELPTGERTAAHARAVELLRARDASAQRLATHLVATDACGERATAATLLEAGQAALASGAPRSAHTYLSRALREPAPDDLRPAILSALVNVGIRMPGRELFAATLPELLKELERTPDLHLRWGIRVSMWMILSGHFGRAVRFLEQGIEIAGARGDVEGAFRMEAQLSAIQQQPLPVWRSRLSGYVDQIPPDSVSGRLAAALTAEWSAFDGTAADAVAAARHALSHDGRIFVEQPELFAPGRAQLALVFADELETARRGAEQALAHARRRSATPELVSAWWHNSFVAWAYGDLAAAEADIRQSLAAARLGRMRFAEPPLVAVLASLLLARGERDAAEAELVEGGLTGEIPDAVWMSLALFPRGQLRLRAEPLRGGGRRLRPGRAPLDLLGRDRDPGAAGAHPGGARARRARRPGGRTLARRRGADPRAPLRRAHARLARAARVGDDGRGPGAPRRAGRGGRRPRRLARPPRACRGAAGARRRAAPRPPRRRRAAAAARGARAGAPLRCGRPGQDGLRRARRDR